MSWHETFVVIRAVAGALLLVVGWTLADIARDWLIARWQLRRWRKVAMVLVAYLASVAIATAAWIIGGTAGWIAGMVVYFVLAIVKVEREVRQQVRAYRAKWRAIDQAVADAIANGPKSCQPALPRRAPSQTRVVARVPMLQLCGHPVDRIVGDDCSTCWLEGDKEFERRMDV
jgi:hypothetical protein